MNRDNENTLQGDAICVYGASSEHISDTYKRAATECGAAIARSGHPLVCGGGRMGLMRCAIEGALSAGGEAIGVLPHFMVQRAWQHPQLTRMIDTADMHERKATMARLSMAVIAAPGGCGTLEELLEIITWRQLGLWRGQVVILNVDGYYDPLVEMLERTIEQGFRRGDESRLWSVASNADEAMEMALKPL